MNQIYQGVPKKRMRPCPNGNCNGTTVKNGFQNHIQRYRCKVCNQNFQESYSYRAYDKTTNAMIFVLLKEGCGILGIARILKISKNTVLSRILKIADRIQEPNLPIPLSTIEMDEMYTYVGNKSVRTWITYAIERKSREVLGFVVGKRSKIQILPLVNKLLLFYPKKIYTDKLNVYPSLIPSEIHRTIRYMTNRIERKNLTLRTHIKRLSRRTICFSKEIRYLEAHLKIYFWATERAVHLV